MARMIPSQIDPETKSDAEKKLYCLLKDMPDTDGWTVIHSVVTAKHPTQSMGEADFVVVIPNKGIIVLEVKGGGIYYSEGEWYSRDRYGVDNKIKNPQNEANQAMRALTDFIAHKNRLLAQCLFGYGVVFPDSEFSPEMSMPDLAPCQIADINSCLNLKQYFLHVTAFYAERKAKGIFIPDQEQAKEIVSYLRPIFEAKISLGTSVKNMENEIISLTQNQQEVFNGLLENERCLIKGSAGTGKTILALNLAIRFAEENKKVAFFCYNRQLALYLKRSLDGKGIVVCECFTDYIEKIMGNSCPEKPSDNIEKYYNELLPEAFFEYAVENNLQTFDCLIVDEAQDLLRDSFLDDFDVLLNGGLSDGCWYMFMDLDKQNIYNGNVTNEVARALLKQRKATPAYYTLSANCRNSINILKKIDSVFHTETMTHLSEEYGNDVEIISCKKPADEAAALSRVLSKLKNNGIKNSDIIVLSPCRFEKSSACNLESSLLAYIPEDSSDKVRFRTIQGFKGLESPVVILTDIDKIFKEHDQKLLYIGMSRARSLLVIIASEQVAKLINSGKGIHS